MIVSGKFDLEYYLSNVFFSEEASKNIFLDAIGKEVSFEGSMHTIGVIMSSNYIAKTLTIDIGNNLDILDHDFNLLPCGTVRKYCNTVNGMIIEDMTVKSFCLTRKSMEKYK